MRKSILLILVFIAFAKCVETEDLLATPSNKAPQQHNDDEPIILDEPLDELRDTPEVAFEKMRKLMKNSFLNTPCTPSADHDAEITEEIHRLTKQLGYEVYGKWGPNDNEDKPKVINNPWKA